jgi:hypothetical protein
LKTSTLVPHSVISTVAFSMQFDVINSNELQSVVQNTLSLMLAMSKNKSQDISEFDHCHSSLNADFLALLYQQCDETSLQVLLTTFSYFTPLSVILNNHSI